MAQTVFTLEFEMLDADQHGTLATYSTREAAEQALAYASIESQQKYYRVWIEETEVLDKFTTNDF